MTTSNLIQQPVAVAVVSQATPQSVVASVPAVVGPRGSAGATGLQGIQGVAGADGIGTVASVGTLISSATEKTTPVDADMLGVMDSAAGNVLKKLSWSNIKATLKTYFDTLYVWSSGKAGGQTLNGGTAAGESITISGTASATKSTSGINLGAMHIDEVNGRVGIGTAAPRNTLNVYSGTGTDWNSYPAGTWAAVINQSQNISGGNGVLVVNKYHSPASTLFELGMINDGSGTYTTAFKVDGYGTASFSQPIKVSGVTIDQTWLNAFSITGNSLNDATNWKSAFIGNGINGANNAGVTIGSNQTGTTPILSVTSGVAYSGVTGNNIPTAQGTARLVVLSNGRTLIGAADDTINTLQVNGSIKSTQFNLSALNTAPASATATGTLGEIKVTATYIYVCTATNTWVRAALATW